MISDNIAMKFEGKDENQFVTIKNVFIYAFHIQPHQIQQNCIMEIVDIIVIETINEC